MKPDRKILREKAKKEFKRINKEKKIPKAKRLPFNAVYKVMISSLNEDILGGTTANSVAMEQSEDLSDMIDNSNEIINS